MNDNQVLVVHSRGVQFYGFDYVALSFIVRLSCIV